jgi:uncharacterized protein HemX
MTPQLQIRIAIGVVAVLACLAVMRELVSDYKIERLRKTTEAQRHRGDEAEARAAAKEAEAASHVKKIESLERSIEEIRKTARRQDEEINNKTNAVRDARIGRERVRSKRAESETVSLAELCDKLAKLGKPCE